MMKHTFRWCQTPPSVTVRVKPNSARSLQIRRGLRLKRANGQDAQGPPEKSQPSQCRDEMYYATVTMPPTIVIQRQEMASYFRLFVDDLILDFLWMDCCCKMTDKYLLAMTFVYFKRAHFTIAEYTRKNFFIALYLANTMEEDEEENKYEIFPWALGKNWRKQFTRFLKQRDKLWARIEYRAAVSRRCCEEVMAIVPSHFVWQRERSEHHSGAQRQYGDRNQARIPRGPTASPVLCALCNRSTRLDQGPDFSFPSGGSPAQTPLPFASVLSLEKTPPRAVASHRKVVETKRQAQHSSCCCADEVPRDESSGSIYDTSMDWISKE
ncbi:speedy protein A isoform X1 [Thunnus maccoyii]|uniref:speedy protein A isoform X1 n=1 Tax=Thunnus maccoyii TaxID=8240 RepID=UPI001C4D71FF|nr:speedy protein A isoform X1 [Thunnus maccoyii]XP_042245079.1 speedy protein A isoform X1 [Thunnus maccoyii]XP_042245080.1 speedy protein A isoform X1 [Thunnus maccoyii]XP_042245081.1 speedy protein A isoform X1 [Thunnus maccoyii]|eukprot:superscaffoldBa00003365_g16765